MLGGKKKNKKKIKKPKGTDEKKEEEEGEEEEFVLDNDEEERVQFFEGTLSQHVSPLFGPKFWQAPRKFCMFTNGDMEKEKLGGKHKLSTANSLSIVLDSNSTMKRLTPEEADNNDYAFQISCTIFTSRNSIFAADITAAPRVVQYRFKAATKASYQEWLYKIKHIMDNTWPADLAVMGFGRQCGLRFRSPPRQSPHLQVKSPTGLGLGLGYVGGQGRERGNDNDDANGNDLEGVLRARAKARRRRKRHNNTKLVLPNQHAFSIALENRHYDSRERSGEILGLFLSNLCRNILLADKVQAAREWRKAQTTAARTASAPADALDNKMEEKEENENPGDDEGKASSDGDDDDAAGAPESKLWQLLGLGSREQKAALRARKEAERQRKVDRRKEREARALARVQDPSTASFLVMLRRRVHRNTVVVRHLTVVPGPSGYRNNLYYRCLTEKGCLVIEYDPQYVWMNLDDIGKDLTGDVIRDWGTEHREKEEEEDRLYSGESDFDSDLWSTEHSGNDRGSDSDNSSSSSDGDLYAHHKEDGSSEEEEGEEEEHGHRDYNSSSSDEESDDEDHCTLSTVKGALSTSTATMSTSSAAPSYNSAVHDSPDTTMSNTPFHTPAHAAAASMYMGGLDDDIGLFSPAASAMQGGYQDDGEEDFADGEGSDSDDDGPENVSYV